MQLLLNLFEFVNWDNCPRYVTTDLSTLMDNTDDMLKAKTHLKVNLDIDITYQEANQIKEIYLEKYPIREITMLPNTNTEYTEDQTEGEIEFETVDKVVLNQLQCIKSETIKVEKLVNIYNSL